MGKLSDFRGLTSTPMDLMDEVASEPVLNQAYAWLCERRLDYSANDDVWDLRRRWEELRPQLQAWLRAGVYRIGAVRRFPASDETVDVWPALDALVLKAIALVPTAHLLPSLSPHRYHVEGLATRRISPLVSLSAPPNLWPCVTRHLSVGTSAIAAASVLHCAHRFLIIACCSIALTIPGLIRNQLSR